MAKRLKVGRKTKKNKTIDFSSKHYPPERIREFQLQENLSEERLKLREAVEARKEAELQLRQQGRGNISSGRRNPRVLVDGRSANARQEMDYLARERLAQRERIQSRKQAEFQAKYNMRVGRKGVEMPQTLYSPKSRIERYQQAEKLRKYEDEAYDTRMANLTNIAQKPVDIAVGLHKGYKKGQELYHETYGPIAHKTYPELNLSPTDKLYAYRKHYEEKYAKPLGIKTGQWIRGKIDQRFKSKYESTTTIPKPNIPVRRELPEGSTPAFHKMPMAQYRRGIPISGRLERGNIVSSLKTSGRLPQQPIVVRKAYTPVEPPKPQGRVVQDRLLGVGQPKMEKKGLGVSLTSLFKKKKEEVL